MTVKRCEHCGQTVMATDDLCWHCGKQLSRSKPQLVQPEPTATAVSTTAPLPSLPVILLYVGLTAVSLIILIITTRAIGQAPLFLLSRSNALQAGWQPVTDSQLRFTLNLPEAWRVIEMNHAPEASSLGNSPPLQALSGLFEALVADTELLFLGAEDTAEFANGRPVFVLVAQSQRLQRLTPDEIIRYAQEQLPENIVISAVNQPEAAADDQRSSFLFNIDQGEDMWRCLEQISPDSTGVYLVTTCTSFAQFPAHLSDFELILHSFQPLGS